VSIFVFTWVVVAVDVTLLVFLTVLWFQAPQMRSRLAMIFGALTPIYSAYAGMAIMYLSHPGAFMSGVAFSLMWVPTFGGVVISLLFGIVMSGIPRPRNLYARFCIGRSMPAILIIWFLYCRS